MKSILIVQRVITHYRMPFFALLSARLRTRGISLDVCYGDAPASDELNAGQFEGWQTTLQTYRLFGSELTLQPISARSLSHYDLVIVEQANRLLLNFWLFLLRPWSRFQIAFWGHGYNHQAGSNSTFSERLKRSTLHWPDWWFAYTGETSRYLNAAHYPAHRITTVDNTIDIRQLIAHLEAIDEAEVDAYRKSLGIAGQHVGLFCGSLYAEKRLDLLFAAALLIRERISDFELIVAGDGGERSLAEKYAGEYPWIHYVGPRFGRDQALLFRVATLQLLPGAVGLAVVDSIVSATPLITTDCGLHGPEIEYLRNGENGLMTAVDAAAYADAVCNVLTDPILLEKLKMNCRTEVHRFHLEAMAERFAEGIYRCLAEGRR